eukprot:2141259-Pyramimonas_sp.AAC.1
MCIRDSTITVIFSSITIIITIIIIIRSRFGSTRRGARGACTAACLLCPACWPPLSARITSARGCMAMAPSATDAAIKELTAQVSHMNEALTMVSAQVSELASTIVAMQKGMQQQEENTAKTEAEIHRLRAWLVSVLCPPRLPRARPRSSAGRLPPAVEVQILCPRPS